MRAALFCSLGCHRPCLGLLWPSPSAVPGSPLPFLTCCLPLTVTHGACHRCASPVSLGVFRISTVYLPQLFPSQSLWPVCLVTWRIVGAPLLVAELMLVPSETSWAISNVKCQATALVKNHMIHPVNWTLNNKILFRSYGGTCPSSQHSGGKNS